ncbi:hypothetical protein K1516_05210 [Stenotrophomonas maltophilia]|uniref:hypothetical protein n=1 Tax=Stenotrophomonas maltophilia TaxID=40324 RepID=UPI00200E12DC|nr:hypothetical protein [Stenotrophomonas maltophilia]UQA71531.1 hypothetical protein K1516_05210 [Stenotrophomonas maltophilia]
MRRFLLLISPLVLLGCSRPAAQSDPTPAPPPAAASAEVQANAETATSALQSPTVDPLFGAVDTDAVPPSVMLNRYVIALLNRDRSTSDAAWAFPPADPRHADDAVLRQLQDLRTLRLDSEPPIARDDQQPPRLLEVPVRIRAVTTQGTFRFGGWYRVQPSRDGRAWQIQSAQLRPSLD